MKQSPMRQADQQLWAAYTRSLQLLPGQLRLPVEPVPASKLAIAPPPAPQGKAAPAASARPVQAGAPPAGLDKSSWKKFSTGAIRPARTLDLHGLTAARAHHATTDFIQRAYGAQLRVVEIISGKGEVLRRELPHWLNGPQLRPLILALAHPYTANTGAVRVLLKRAR